MIANMVIVTANMGKRKLVRNWGVIVTSNHVERAKAFAFSQWFANFMGLTGLLSIALKQLNIVKALIWLNNIS